MHSLLIALNVIRRTIQGKKGLLTFIIIPTICISIFIGISGREPSGISQIYYTNSDQGALGEHLITQLSSNPNYQLTSIDTLDQLKENVIARNTQAAFLILDHFTEDLLAGQKSQIELFQLNVNEASFTLKLHIDQAIQMLEHSIHITKSQTPDAKALNAELDHFLLQQEKQLIHADVTDYDLYVNPALFLVTGFLLMFMMNLVNGTVTIVLEDRQQKTMARIFVAPVRSYEIALGNFMGSMMMGIMQITGVLLLTKYVIGFNYGISFFSHLLILTTFLLAIMGIASTVAGLIRNSSTVAAINSLIVTPTCMIGGCFWPVAIMPDFLQKIANFVPQKWAIDAILSMAGGQSLIQVWMNLAILGLFALILLGFGSVILKPSESQVS
jgi:ABC-2 type transport system permease protein